MKKLLTLLALIPSAAHAQGTPADYARANGLRARYEAMALNVPGAVTWADDSSQFWYRRSVKGGHEFVVFDVATRAKQPAFDHAKLAAALSTAADKKYDALTLPMNTVAFVDKRQAIEFTADGVSWRCALDSYTCRK